MVVAMITTDAIWRVLRRALAVIAGCGALTATSCAGKRSAPHPSIKLLSSSIKPQHKIAVGEVLHARAQTNIPMNPGDGALYLCSSSNYVAGFKRQLYDDGTHGDQTANDDEWAPDLVWGKDCSQTTTGQLEIMLEFSALYAWQEGAKVDLVVTAQPVPGKAKQ
jgi:hypothetical protein